MNENPRVVAILAVRNESLYIRTVIEHLIAEGVKCVVIDNQSDDDTVAICREYYPEHVLAIENIPYPGYYDWQTILARKDELRKSVEADWIIYHDADEIMHSNRPGETLVQAIVRVDSEGYNAINFDEFVFIHEDDAADYSGSNYYQSMHHYYYFQPAVDHPRLVRAYSKAVQGDIAWSGGHMPRGNDVRIYKERMVLRHYICLSKAHVVSKYAKRTYSEKELKMGWHRNRVGVQDDRYCAPAAGKLTALGDDLRALDYSNPYNEHYWHWGDLRWYLWRRKQRLHATWYRILHRLKR